MALAEVARDLGWRVESVDYRGIDSVEARLSALLAACAGFAAVGGSAAGPVLVGSSLGGFLSAAASIEVRARGLFLMAPAFDLPGLPRTPVVERCPTVVVHGWGDDVVPVEKGLAFARAQGALMHLVDDDHRLHASLPRMTGWLRDFLGGLGA